MIVNGNDRVDRLLNTLQPYGAGDVERVRALYPDSADPVVQVAQAIQEHSWTVGIETAQHRAIDLEIQLTEGNKPCYQTIIWVLGEDAQQLGTTAGGAATITTAEQLALAEFIDAGGNFFVSGAELADDLGNLGHGTSFLNNYLQATFVDDRDATRKASGVAGSIFTGLSLAYGPDNAAPETAFYAQDGGDVLSNRLDGQPALTYGAYTTMATAAVQVDGEDGHGHVVTFGFPFERIQGSAMQAEVMRRILDFFGIWEERLVYRPMAVDDLAVAVTDKGTALTILGSGGRDSVLVQTGSIRLGLNGRTPDALVDADAITRIIVVAGPGGGRFDFRDSPRPLIFVGGNGDDEVYGSPFNDIIYAGGGNDYVRGGDGADDLFAMGGDADVLHGGAGDDRLDGSDGGAMLNGGAGSDTFIVLSEDQVQDAGAEDEVTTLTERAAKRRRDRINSRYLEQQNVASPSQTPVKVWAGGTPEITEFTISSNVVTEGDSVVFTVRAAAANWARLVLFADENGDGQYQDGVDIKLGQFRGRNQDWRGQIGTASLGPGTFEIRAMLLPFSGSPAVSNPITLNVEEELVLPAVAGMPDSVEIDPEDVLVLLPHRNAAATVLGNTLVGEGIDLWEITPRTGGGFRFWTEGTTDTVVALYDASGNRIGEWDSDNGLDENGELLVTLSDDTTYYFAVAAETGDGGTYDLHVTGHNQTVEGDIVLSPVTHVGSTSATFSGNHRLDYFRMRSPADVVLLDVSVQADPSLDLWLRIADEDNKLIGLGRPGDVVLTDLPAESDTIYFVTVYALYGTDGSYIVTADFHPDESGFPVALNPVPDLDDWLIPLHDGRRSGSYRGAVPGASRF